METTHNKRAVIYCRVSTKEQVEEGNSLVTQEKNCREYALKNGFEVVAIFIEQGESAKTADRTELKKLMSFCAIKKNNINAVISYKIDRISRNTDDYSQIRLLLKRYGVEIKSTSEYFEDTPAGRFMENIIANVAQFDNDVRAERSTGGMKDAVREGRYVWMAPFGFSNVKVNGKATIAQNEFAPVVQKIFEDIASNNYPIEIIRKNLIIENNTGKSGKQISKSAFYRIVKNELYTGWIEKFGERHYGQFEPIISEELFQFVQQKLFGKSTKIKQYKTESPDFPLRRFIKHTSGAMFTGAWSKGRTKKYPYYLIRKCNINLKKDVLENSFKYWLNQFKIDIEYFEKLKAFVKEKLSNGFNTQKTEVDNIQNKIEALKEKQVVLVEKNIQGVITDELCKTRLAAIDVELYQLRKAVSEKDVDTFNYTHAMNIIREVLLNPAAVWERVDFKTKIKLQWFYFPHGIIFDGIECRTNKICKLFKLKEQLSTSKYQVVNYPVLRTNTSNLQIPLRYEKDITNSILNPELEELFTYDLGQEIIYLSELMKDNSCSSEEHHSRAA